MFVDSYLELYTTILGWMLYNLIYNILVATGLIFIPIAFLIFKSWKAASVNSKGTPAAELSIKNIAWDIAIMFIVILLVVVPSITVFPSQVQFTPTSATDGRFKNTVNAQNSNTSFDRTLGAVATESPSIPLWWLFVYRTMSGINYAIIDSLSAHMDMDVAKQQIAAANISDPNLAHQLPAFVSSCFVPARGKLSNWLGADSQPANVRNRMNEPDFNPEELDWIGSRMLVETPGLYAPCSDRDVCQEDLVANYSIKGLPEGVKTPCSTWWSSLRQDLLAQSDASIWDSLCENFAGMAGLSEEEVQDMRIRTVLANHARNTLPLADNAILYQGDQGGVKSIGRYLQSMAGAVGTTTENIKLSTKMHVVKLALPMIQALLLMMIYGFLPFFMLVARFELGSIFTLTIIVAAIKFMTAIWAIAGWVEFNLYEALYPSNSILSSGTMGFINSVLQDSMDNNLYLKGRLLSILTAMLWVLMPGVLFYGLVWIGVNAGSTLSGAVNSSTDPAQSAGSSSGGVAGKGVSMVKTAATKGAAK